MAVKSVRHGRPLVIAKILKNKVEQLPPETKAEIKADVDALKTQRKDHMQLIRDGRSALQAEVEAARADGTVTEEEKAKIKAGAEALQAQAKGFREQDRATLKSIIKDILDALRNNTPALPPEPAMQ